MRFEGIGPAASELSTFLAALDRGEAPRDIERHHVDAKEEAGRRDGRGRIMPGPADLDEVARQLLREAACMANTPGGGIVVVGVANDGTRTGATVDGNALRHRVYELSGRRLTLDVRPFLLVDGTRLLLCTAQQALEPIRVRDRITWRVDDNCVEVDLAIWAVATGGRHHDWSLEPSDRAVRDVTPAALAELRRTLDEAGDERVRDLVDAPDLELLRRIPNVLTDDDRLTNAGRLLLTTIPPAIVYVHRPAAGADSTIRVELEAPLLVQRRRVLEALEARRRTVHHRVSGGSERLIDALPPRAAREAILNALVHRDWQLPEPVWAEHVGDRLRVRSPGGLVGTVTTDNILTHPSMPRYRGLAETVAHLRLAEREGIGVDRMFAEMVRLGRPVPDITEVAGPVVDVDLLGGDPDLAWLRLLDRLHPSELRDDLHLLLALRSAVEMGWVSASSLARSLQDTVGVAESLLERLADVRLDGQGGPDLLVPIEGRPEAAPPARRPSLAVREAMRRPAPGPEALLAYARDAGRISSTEVVSLSGVSGPTAAQMLKDLGARGGLRPSSPSGRGRGFHWLPVDS